jgi:hypothetical protein
VSEKTLSDDDVRQEHLREVDVRAHWTYLFTVLFGSTALMVVFIALLDAMG